jgi:hypothetical protein
VNLFRLLLIVIIVVAALIAVDAQWNKDSHSLTLRLREKDEAISLIRDRALSLGEEAVRAASRATGSERAREGTLAEGAGTPQPPHVGAPASGILDDLTQEDRRALDDLIEMKIRESAGGTPAGAN